ncbi:MAG: heparinase II/III family protein [Actinomycetota bacterium]|nr:heparinase II/III family protein [Actinomycetota bacterium]
MDELSPLTAGSWHRDPATGHEFPLIKSSRVRLVDPEAQRDARSVWERSRFTILPSLAAHSLLTGRPHGAERCVTIVRSWIAENPVGRGVNWTVAMEVAIRAMNVALASSLLDSTLLTATTQSELDRFLLVHARWISRNLERSDLLGNHLVTDLVGMFWLGCYFEGTRFGDRLVARSWPRAADGLVAALDMGAPKEGSVPYQAFMFELALYAVRLANDRSLPIPARLPTSIDRTIDFLQAFSTPEGHLVGIGDSDDGRLVRFGARPPRDISALLAALGRVDVTVKDASPSFELECGLLRGATLGRGVRQPAQSCLLGGWVRLHSASVDVWMRCDGRSLRGRGHAHADLLSVVINFHGNPLVVDPGNPRYGSSREERVAAIGAVAHNAPLLAPGGYALSEFYDLPGVEEVAAGAGLLAEEGCSAVRAYHDGYQGTLGARLHREVRLSRTDAVIIDWTESTALPPTSLTYTLAPGHFLNVVAPGVAVVAGRPDGRVITIRIRVGDRPVNLCAVERPTYPTYGTCVLAPALIADGFSLGPRPLQTTIDL